MKNSGKNELEVNSLGKNDVNYWLYDPQLV